MSHTIDSMMSFSVFIFLNSLEGVQGQRVDTKGQESEWAQDARYERHKE